MFQVYFHLFFPQGRQSLGRYHSAKRRGFIKEKQATAQLVEAAAQAERVENEVTGGTSIGVQTDLTMVDIEQLELNNKELLQDNASRRGEITELKLELVTRGYGNGYPSEKQLKDDSKLVTFYTGLSSFTVLMAIFEFLMKGNTALANMKLSPFACLTMTLMKLRLNVSNFDLAFRFGVCNMTVKRVLRKCIFHMDSMMGKSLIKWPT